MSRAIAQSCNTYFVHVMQQVPQAQFLLMAQNLGFGSSVEIAPGFSSAAGDLPTLDSLNIPKALANFSFGQGDLTATPVQIAGMVNAIASGGEYTAPTIYEGFVNENLQYLDRAKTPATRRVMTEHTASLLRSFMEESVKEGTSEKFAPASGGAGAKDGHCADGKIRGRRGKGHLLGGGVLPPGGAALCHHRNGRGWNGRRGHLWPGV